MSKAFDDVLTERYHQINEEGWTIAHDDQHEVGQLAKAGAAYALYAVRADNDRRTEPPPFWPWGHGWWKPKSQRRDLVRAAALILAEIEKIDRAYETKA